jgi:hypothetical protein
MMHYNKQKIQIKNDATSFVGGSWQQDISDYSLNVDGIINIKNYIFYYKNNFKW